MNYVRKTYDLYELMTDYGYGEEVETSSTNRGEIIADLKRYLEEKKLGFLPSLVSVRVRTRRVRKEN